MPIYEFKCKQCGNVFEELRSLSKHDEKAECPSCKAGAEKMMSCCAPTPGSSLVTPGGSCGGSGGFS
ncbi:MAG: zinc ribbon domain-containing protein [candidate division Zixibacteria bacterium]|nr:zinc ribbon domain-containing protein [candidate division Zixibacteria bacterium]